MPPRPLRGRSRRRRPPAPSSARQPTRRWDPPRSGLGGGGLGGGGLGCGGLGRAGLGRGGPVRGRSSAAGAVESSVGTGNDGLGAGVRRGSASVGVGGRRVGPGGCGLGERGVGAAGSAGTVSGPASAVSLPPGPVPVGPATVPVSVGPTAADPVPVSVPDVVPVAPVRSYRFRCDVPVVPVPVVPVPVVPVPVVPVPVVPVVPVSVLVVPPPVPVVPVVPVSLVVSVPPVVVPVVAPVDPVAGPAGLATTGGAGLSLPVVRGAPWARTEVSGSVCWLGVVVAVRFGSLGSGSVSAATASSMCCWSASWVWPSSSLTFGNAAATAASTCSGQLGLPLANQDPGPLQARADDLRGLDRPRPIREEDLGDRPCGIAWLCGPAASGGPADTQRGDDDGNGRAAQRVSRGQGLAGGTGASARGADARRSRVATEAAAAAAVRGAPPGPSPGSPSGPWSAGRRSARDGRWCPDLPDGLGRGTRGPDSRTVGGSRSGRRSVTPSVSSCSGDPASGAPSSEDPAARRPGGRRQDIRVAAAAGSTPTVSSAGAAVTGRRCGAGPVAATSGSVGAERPPESGRALAAHAASMAMSGSSSARSSAPPGRRR